MGKETFIKTVINILPIVLFILIGNPLYKFLLTLLYIVISIIGGKKFKPFPNIMMFISIIFIYMLNPYGKVLYNFSFIYITEGSLFEGLNKASLLIGMIQLSRNISFTNIKLKGEIGLLTQKTFFYLNQLTNSEKINPKTIISDLDKKLLSLSNKIETTKVKSATNKSLKIYINLIITLIFFTIDIIGITP